MSCFSAIGAVNMVWVISETDRGYRLSLCGRVGVTHVKTRGSIQLVHGDADQGFMARGQDLVVKIQF